MKNLLFVLTLISLNAFAEIKTIEQEIRTKYCYLTVIEPIIISAANDFVMAGDVKLTVISREYQKSRRLQSGRTFKVKSIDGNLISVEDKVIRNFCVMGSFRGNPECQDVSESSKATFSVFSRGSLKLVCEDKPMIDV